MDIARESIKRKIVVLFSCAMVVVGGISAYFTIGKLEDPGFTIKTAVVSIVYPGSTAYEVEEEVASRMEDAIQEMSEVKKIVTRCTPGVAVLQVEMKDEYTEEKLPAVWNKLRQKVSDKGSDLPSGCYTYVNDDYGAVFGQYYAVTGDGYSMRDIYEYIKFLKKNLVLVPGVAKISILGAQSEGIYVEFSSSRLRSLGIAPSAIFNVLNQQNTLSSMGRTFHGDQYVTINPTGSLLTVEDFSDIVVGSNNGNVIKLRDVASIRHDYVDPQSMMMFFNGQPAIGFGIATAAGGNVVTMGQAVTKRLEELEADRPIGMELHEVYMQSEGVVSSVNDFVINVIESVVIVVGVLLVFMGARSGLMIGLVLLLTIAGTLMLMDYNGIFLQQISLAALIIALGSLVDNAIVVAEGILVGVQKGQSSEDAASDVVTSSMWAMLGGTVIAILAFAPIGLSPDSTGEYCQSLFQVVGISMLLSWILAITATPVLGDVMLRASPNEGDPYDKLLFRVYKSFLELCLRFRIITVAVVIGMFVLAIFGFGYVKFIFFPASTSPYVITDLWQRKGTSINAQKKMTEKLVETLLKHPDIEDISSFIGSGSLRFMLSYSPPEADDAFSELFVKVREGGEVTHNVIRDIQRIIDEEMPDVIGVAKLLPKGSGSGAKIQARFYGDDTAVLREIAGKARAIMEKDPVHNCVKLDWFEPVPVFHPQIRKDVMQSLGLTRTDINIAILTATQGYTVGQFRDGDESLSIIFALKPEERHNIENLRSWPIWSSSANQSVPLGTIVSDIDVAFEDSIIYRRNRKRVLTVESDVTFGSNVADMQNRIRAEIEAIELPHGYFLEWDGEEGGSNDAMNGMKNMIVPSILLMFIIMVFLFNAFRQPIIIFSSVPLIVIGVVLGLFCTGKPLDFLSIVGILSLVGMLAKNSIVLLDQLASDFASGKDRYQSIVDTGVSRLRPVAMSAFTTVLGMVPLLWDQMFGSMAVTIMGGLTVSSVLTMIFIPVCTAIAYRAPCPGDDYDDDYESEDASE